MAIDFSYQAVNEPPSTLPDMVFLDIKNYTPTMILWCNKNITKYWCYCPNWNNSYTFYFESAADKAIFILRWI